VPARKAKKSPVPKLPGFKNGRQTTAAAADKPATSEEECKTPPPRPPLPKIFGPEDDPTIPVELPSLPESQAEVVLPERNPKLYELVQMSEDSSFWWDSVDANEDTSELTLETDFQAGLNLQSMRKDLHYDPG
jgi:hypothetical protein